MRRFCCTNFVGGLWALIFLLFIFKASATSDQALIGHPFVKAFYLNDTYIDESQLVYGSEDNQIVYIRSHKGDVYRSNNEGKSWSAVTTVFLMDRINQTTNRVWRHAKGASMYDGSNMMYFWSAITDRIAGYQQLLWITNDGGLSFRLRLNMPRNVDNIIPHPKFPGVALLLQNTQFPGRSQLFKTFDAGLTWTSIFKPLITTSRVQWACTRSHPHRILAATTLGLTSATSVYWNNKVISTDDYFQTYRLYLDHVHDWRVILRTPYDATSLISSRYISKNAEARDRIEKDDDSEPTASNPFAPHDTEFYRMIWPSHEPEQEVRVLVSRYSSPSAVPTVEISRNFEPKWERTSPDWLSVEFARGGLVNTHTNGWHVYSTKNNSMNLLAWRSDSHHELYRVEVDWKFPWPGKAKSHLLLSHHKTSTYVDFETLPGVIVADQFALSPRNTLTGAWHSLVSSTAGAAWQKLMAPDSNATHPRHLVFAGITNTSPLVYSMPRNLGIIFATATSVSNENHLPLNYSHGNRPPVDTYATHDGGQHWQKLGYGYQVPEFAANGAMAIFADRNGNLVRHVTVSADDGQTWLSIPFTDTPVRIYNIRVTQDYSSRNVLVHASRHWSDTVPSSPPSSDPNMGPGTLSPPHEEQQSPSVSPLASEWNLETEPASAAPYDPSGTHIIDAPMGSYSPMAESPPSSTEPTTEPSLPFAFQSILFSLDFIQAFPRCQPSDYETWTPTDSNGNVRCLLGEKFFFQRRKAGHHCYPQPPPEPNASQDPWPIVLSREPCVCTLENFECAPCFEFDQTHGRCRFICGLEDQTFILSRYPTIPFKQEAICNTNALGFYEWPGSKKFAMQRVSESKCTLPGPSESSLEFLDAIVPCALAPTITVPEAPVAKTPSKLSKLTIRAFSIVILTLCVIGIFFFVLRNLYTIQYRVGQAIEYFFPSEHLVGRMNLEDFEFDEDGSEESGDEAMLLRNENEVEMDEIAVPETTTSSDEEQDLLD